jgi:hypothetical protein
LTPLCSFKSLQKLHLTLDAYPVQKFLVEICTNLANLREFLLDIPCIEEEQKLDDFCSIIMHPPAKRYLRLRDLFCAEDDDYFLENQIKDEFFEKYLSLYPSHLDLPEDFINCVP